jgi:intergrase/recombinase
MNEEYLKYQEECERIRNENKVLLSDFRDWLTKSGLVEKTIEQHVRNIDLYINYFLLYEDPTKAADGIGEIGMFLGYWFIKKALWSSKSQIKQNAASLKKFYTFMHERGLVSAEDLNDLKEKIKEDMLEWLATMERYEDPSIEDPAEIWGL